MIELEDCEYSQDATVAAVRDFFSYLESMYLDDSMIVWPPAGGWPSITPEKLEAFGKSETVGDLIRHLPCVKKGDEVDVYPECVWADWGEIFAFPNFLDNPRRFREGTEVYEYVDHTPSSIIGIAFGDWQKQGNIMLDTENGVVYWNACPEDLKHNPPMETVTDYPHEWVEDDAEADWRGDSVVWRIQDFFEVLKIQFRDLKAIPLGSSRTELMPAEGNWIDEQVKAAYNIYRQHEWPDMDKYRKDESMTALAKALKDD